MNKIERRLKREAGAMLPDATLKERIRSECFGDRVFEEVAEPALVAETAGTTKTGRAPLSRNKRFAVAVALALIVCFVVGMSCYFALAKVPVAVSDTFVSININPSFGITADANDKVTSVTALNEDAAVVLYGMNLVGLSVSDAADRIVTESAKLGYLDTTSVGSMSFLAVNENGEKETAVANKLNLSLTALMAKNNWQTTVNSENADYANNGGSSSSYRFKFDFGRNSMSVGYTLLTQRAGEKTGQSASYFSRFSAESMLKLISDYNEESMAKVESALEQSWQNNSQLQDSYDKLQQLREEHERFIADIEAVLEILDDSDGYLTEEERQKVRDLLSHPNLNLDGALDKLLEMIFSFAEDIEDAYDSISDLLEDILDKIEDSIYTLGSDLEEEINNWKKDFLEDVFDD